MPRIRTIKPEMFQDEKLAVLAPMHRFVWIGLISMADDKGRLLDNLKTIDAFIFPFTEESSRDSIEKLASMSRLLRYTAQSGQKLLQIVNWHLHQKVDKASAYCLPEPSTEDLARLELSASRETVAKPSRDSREIVATKSRLDLGPTTPIMDPDHGATSSATSLTRTRDEMKYSAVRLRIDSYFGDLASVHRTKKAKRLAQIDIVFAYWVAIYGMDPNRTLLDNKRSNLIKRRLDESDDLSEILFAVDGAKKDKVLTEGGFDGIETILRDRGQIERLAKQMKRYRDAEIHPMAKKLLIDEHQPAATPPLALSHSQNGEHP